MILIYSVCTGSVSTFCPVTRNSSIDRNVVEFTDSYLLVQMKSIQVGTRQ
jgi:hypothetical protein